MLAPLTARLWRGVLVELVLSRTRALPAFLARETPSPRVLGLFSPAAHKPSASSCGHAMASTHQGQRDEPPPDQLANLYSLVDKIASAGVLNRPSRAVELSARAALKAEALS